MTNITIVGASLAGVHAARAIRAAGFEGEIIMVGEESHRPYDRPPLSKQYLTTDYDREKLSLRITKEPGALDLQWKVGDRATSLDLDNKSVQLASGDSVNFDGLVVATGSRARELAHLSVPASLGAQVLMLRTLDDAMRIKAMLKRKPNRLVICGAGFIGLEVASSARELGIEVTVIDIADIPLNRVLNRRAALAVARLHREQGVDLRLGVGLETVAESSKRSRVNLQLTDGSKLQADGVVIGVGAAPNVEWLQGTGLDLSDGLAVDQTCLAAPSVVAAGDVARWPNELFGGRLMRVGQWDNAVEMGAFAGARLVAAMRGETDHDGFAPVPWFWSDQFGQKIQLAGLVTDRSVMAVGDYGEERVVELFSDERDVLVGALAWNRPRHAILARQLIAEKTPIVDATDSFS